MLLVWKLVDEAQNFLEPLGTIIHQNSQFYHPSEPFSFHHFNMRHPVLTEKVFLKMFNYIHMFRGDNITFLIIYLYYT